MKNYRLFDEVGIPETEKSDTGDPLHTQEPVTVASFRTWRGWRECIARDRCLTAFDSNIGSGSEPDADARPGE